MRERYSPLFIKLCCLDYVKYVAAVIFGAGAVHSECMDEGSGSGGGMEGLLPFNTSR